MKRFDLRNSVKLPILSKYQHSPPNLNTDHKIDITFNKKLGTRNPFSAYQFLPRFSYEHFEGSKRITLAPFVHNLVQIIAR